ncbi:MAG TPA: Rpn family recombination-promoting nuclease/putative transposase [Polyangiaceae bacterium]|nr:Rpn family recombination-promoting nuclease/putative transposase [Polyangiaceae bacterium]
MQDRTRVPKRKTLDPKLDIVFWMLFAAPQNRELLISLLNAVLRLPAPIESLEVLPTQPEKLAVGGKSIALDLRVRLTNGEQVDVEMQSQRRRALRERALYYWARMYVDQLRTGDPYTELRRCIVVLITDFVELAGARFHSTFRIEERQDHYPLTDHLELHVIELPKMPNAQERNDEPTLAMWGKFLAAETDDQLEQLAMEHPVFKQAKAALDRLSADEIARLQAQQREMALLTYEAGIAAEREDAKREGFREGLREGQAALLLRLLTLKFGPQPASVSDQLANAAQTDLMRWSEKVLEVETIEALFAQTDAP